MNDDWKFDLQLFAEGDGDDGVADTGGEVVTDTGNDGDDGEASLIIPGKLGLKDGRLEYIEDDGEGDGGGDDGGDDEGDGDEGGEEGNPAEKQGEKQQAEGDGGEQKPSFYSPEELFSIASANIAALDPARIPPESIPLYRALVANQVQQPQAKEPEKKTEQETPLTPEEIEEKIRETAMATVVSKLKAKGEEFDDLNPEHLRELVRTEARLEREMEKAANQSRLQAEEARKAAEETKKVYAQIGEKARKLQQQAGPDFAGVDKLTETHLHTLPFAQAAPIAAAIERLTKGQATEADIPVLEGYWEDCRREYFAKKTGVTKEPKPVPPQTLKPGSDKEPKERFDPKAIGNMDQDSRIEYYKRTGLADRLVNLS